MALGEYTLHAPLICDNSDASFKLNRRHCSKVDIFTYMTELDDCESTADANYGRSTLLAEYSGRLSTASNYFPSALLAPVK